MRSFFKVLSILFSFLSVVLIAGGLIYGLVQLLDSKNPGFKKRLKSEISEGSKELKQVFDEEVKDLGKSIHAVLNKRQRRLISLLQDNGIITLNKIRSEFSEVTERTLRRDLEKLEKLGFILRRGKTKSSTYEIKKIS